MVGSVHKPVLLKESLELLNVKEGGIYIDCTLGGGGYAKGIISKLLAKGEPASGGKSKNSRLLCFDTDGEAIDRFKSWLLANNWKRSNDDFKKNGVEVILKNINFENLGEVLDELEIESVQGIVADLGVSSDQLDEAERGFSYSKEGPLDMRMDRRLGVTAEDLLVVLPEKELERIFKEQDERFAGRIARLISEERKRRKIQSTKHLIQIIKNALPFRKKVRKAGKPSVCAYWTKSAMRVFQALRIAVNSELSSLQKMLPQALEALSADKTQGGRFVVVTFHSGEDRIVKNFIKENKDKIRLLTDKYITPSDQEKDRNLRSRSAKLRAFEKLSDSEKQVTNNCKLVFSARGGPAVGRD
ncbi:MAG: 16S rRNA (cytosine(1402)-N(4))-methyltransferase RsmH [Candidatus Dojkabacteria bacterium]|nr:16S rRNA (cytosine(1402)-N(4))-methyltransferase RsmH [Candidatus Dojkabacteria bacterium]